MDAETPQAIRAWLEREQALGLEVVPRAAASAPAAGQGPGAGEAGARPARPARPAQAAAPAANRPEPEARAGRATAGDVLVEPAIAAAADLGALRDVLGDCRRCKLCEGRTNIVFGVGNPEARLVFVGEGPGEDEDRQGEPFVGKAGQLLDRIITSGMGLRRADVYIANVIKCRPPNNRNPQPDEIVACEPFLRRQIELLKPDVLVSLGNFATQALLGERTAISRRRGHWHEFLGIPLMPTFHPAYLLRNPSDKRLVWSDIQLVMDRLGLQRPAASGRGGKS